MGQTVFNTIGSYIKFLGLSSESSLHTYQY